VTEWDEAEFLRKKKDEFEEVVAELRENNSLRAESLILTNFIESVLKDIMEYDLQTKYARKISRQIIVDILYDKGILNEELKNDIKRIFNIRDLYGHNLSIPELQIEVEKIIATMNVTVALKGKIVVWDKLLANEQLSRVAIKIIPELDNVFADHIVKRSRHNDVENTNHKNRKA